MPGGTKSAKVAWLCAVGREVYTLGAMSGSEKVATKRKSQNALAYLQVSICKMFHSAHIINFYLILEKFETRDLKWAPDGKGLVLFDKDMFCCAFEVEEEDTTV